VSVIVPAYGLARLLGEALASLQAQELEDWEAIVVDDGDDEVAAAFAPVAADPRLRLLRTDNRGPATARNRALGVARAPYAALLDADDLYEPSCLARLVSVIEADPDLAFVSCDATLFGPCARSGRYSELFPMDGPVTLDRVLDRRVTLFVGAIIRRAALDAIDGFDPELRGVEDLDLWIRLLAAGWRGAVLLEPLARYRRRASSLSSDERAMLQASCLLYGKAAAALDGRPEQAVARDMLAACERRLRWLEGEAMILGGQPDAGLRLLADAAGRSRRWRTAMAVMRRAPWLAAPLLRLRARIPPPRTPAGRISRPASRPGAG
jgi:GT2 family glycosyltransferase